MVIHFKYFSFYYLISDDKNEIERRKEPAEEITQRISSKWKEQSYSRAASHSKWICRAFWFFLDEKLGNEACNDTLKFTIEYLNDHSLDTENIVAWLKNKGGYCDCEVLNNIEEKFENLS